MSEAEWRACTDEQRHAVLSRHYLKWRRYSERHRRISNHFEGLRWEFRINSMWRTLPDWGRLWVIGDGGGVILIPWCDEAEGLSYER